VQALAVCDRSRGPVRRCGPAQFGALRVGRLTVEIDLAARRDEDHRHDDDQLDAMLEDARARWAAGGGDRGAIGMAAEGSEVSVDQQAPQRLPS